MKLFFGLALEPELALAVADWRDRQFGFSARPVPVANFHITLAYAGELSVLDSDILCEQVDSWHAKGKFRSGQLLLDQTGYWASPGIYWLGPAEATPALASAAAKLDSLIAARGARPQHRKNFSLISLYLGSAKRRRLCLPSHLPLSLLTAALVCSSLAGYVRE